MSEAPQAGQASQEQALTSTPPPAPPADDEKPSSEREYHIFKVAQPDVFQRISTVTATSPQNALKTLGVEVLQKDEYTACTARSWFAPGKPNVKTNTTISFGG